MEENQNNQNNVNKQNDFKQEARERFNNAKEQVKNFDFKGEAAAGKGLLKKLWKEPINTIKEIATDSENKIFKTSIILLIVWLLFVIVDRIIYYAHYEYIDFEFLDALKVFLAPVLGIGALVGAIFALNRKSQKNPLVILSTIIVTRIPLIVSEIIGYLVYIGENATYITTPLSRILSAISLVLTYFAVKFLFGEEDETKTFKIFVLVECIYYVAYLVLRFLGIYI